VTSATATRTATTSAPSVAPPIPQPVSLAQLREGAMARVHAQHLASEDCALLRALGLTDRCLLRVCKAGEPCIVQVRETRIGLSRELARGIFVIPEATATA
jgi:Fe2+ transport system protein FeoA